MTPHVLKGEKVDLPPIDKLEGGISIPPPTEMLEGVRVGSPPNLKGG